MVDVLADIVQIIVLASSTNALLRVAGSLQLGKRTGGVDLGVRGDCECNLSQEDGLVLIHSGIRKKKRRIVEGNNGGGFDKGVSVVLKELDKGATHLGRRPGKFGHESVQFYVVMEELVLLLKMKDIRTGYEYLTNAQFV